MKKLLYCSIAIVAIGNILLAQENNPYNNVGANFVSFFKTVKTDYEELKLKYCIHGMLDFYIRKFGFDHAISLEEFATLTGTVKNSSFQDAIDNSHLSNSSKEILKQSPKGNLENLVDTVIKSNIDKSEKEVVLSYLAIFNGIISNPQLFPASTDKCWICWVGVGAVTGSAICGPACAFVGGIVGAIFGGHEKDTEKSQK